MVHRSGVSATRLMEESESRIETVRRQDWSPHRQIVEKLFESPRTYMRWESDHFRLMRNIAQDMRADSEVNQLRHACFALIHNKALFQYLRDNQVTGSDRTAIFHAYYGAQDYSSAVIAEHGRFLRATWSLLCADHIGANVLRDPVFIQDLPDYEATYAEYVGLYCGRIVAEQRGIEYASQSLIDYMKNAAAERRVAMLAVAPRRRAADAGQGMNRGRVSVRGAASYASLALRGIFSFGPRPGPESKPRLLPMTLPNPSAP